MEAQLRLKILRTMNQWLDVCENSIRRDEPSKKIIQDFVSVTETRIQAERTLIKELEVILERPMVCTSLGNWILLLIKFFFFVECPFQETRNHFHVTRAN